MSRGRKLGVALAVVVLLIVVANVITRYRAREIVLVGIVDANEVVVTPPVQARIDSLLVDEGSEVKAGQPIAHLDRRELAAVVAAAGATAASVRAQVGQATATAQQAAGEAESAIAAARARVSAARADLLRQEAELARLRLDATRSEAMLKGGGMSQADVDRA